MDELEAMSPEELELIKNMLREIKDDGPAMTVMRRLLAEVIRLKGTTRSAEMYRMEVAFTRHQRKIADLNTELVILKGREGMEREACAQIADKAKARAVAEQIRARGRSDPDGKQDRG